MSTILWFIIIGALFYFIMRKGGCCGGQSHGEHSQHSGHSLGNSNPDSRTKDPVCGMEIEVNDAATMKLQHMDQTFYFCSLECKEKFDKNPTLNKAPSQKQGGCC